MPQRAQEAPQPVRVLDVNWLSDTFSRWNVRAKAIVFAFFVMPILCGCGGRLYTHSTEDTVGLCLPLFGVSDDGTVVGGETQSVGESEDEVGD